MPGIYSILANSLTIHFVEIVKDVIKGSTAYCAPILVVILGTPIVSYNFINFISFFRDKIGTHGYQENHEDCLHNDLRVYLTVANSI